MKPKSPEWLHYPDYIRKLDSRKAYTPRDVIQAAKDMGIFDPNDSESKALKRLQAHFRRFEQHHEGDAIHEEGENKKLVRAYYGARLKMHLPEKYISEEERLGCRVILESLTGQPMTDAKPQGMSLIMGKLNALERLLEQIAKRLSWRYWVRWAPKLGPKKGALALLLAATLSVLLIFALRNGDEPWTLESGMNNRIAVLYCLQGDNGPVFASGLATALQLYHEVEVVEMGRVTRVVDQDSALCEQPSPEQWAALSEALEAPLLIWGRLREEGQRSVFDGWLYRRDEGLRAIEAQALQGLSIFDAVASACMAELGVTRNMPYSSVHFHSRNPSANLLHSEAMIQYDRGNIAAASAMFERARVFDPDFVAASNMYGRCLMLQGRHDKAEQVLERLRSRPERTSLDLKLQTYRHLARNYYWTDQYDKLEALLVWAKDLAREHDPDLYGQFLEEECKAACLSGRKEKARALLEALVEWSEKYPDWETLKIRTLRVHAFLERHQGSPEQSLEILFQALSLGKSEEPNSIPETLKQLMLTAQKVNDEEVFSLILQEIDEADALVGTALTPNTRFKLKYLRGQIYRFLGNIVQAGVNLRIAAKGLDFIDQEDLAVEAQRAFARLYLDRGLFHDAELELQFLVEKTGDAISPKHSWRIFDDIGLAILSQDRYQEAIPYLEQARALVEKTHDKAGQALVLNRMGWSLFKVTNYDAAEAAYESALEATLEDEGQKPLKTLILKNLKLLYEEIGDSDRKQKIDALLNEGD